ncbi:MAG: endonuclease III domain-containing protein [Gammaproteobacteria bacterium]|nr:endonuclease III domain-containing protein [Gammaproteobacteria bacterium]
MSLKRIYNTLFKKHGPQYWWPGDTPFEIMVGSVLTQNTAWTNVEKAIHNLKQAKALSPETILATHHARLAKWLRPSGYFNIKAKRLKNYCHWYVGQGGFKSLSKLDTHELRTQLLSVNGVGPETADDIVLYAFERPVFVIDAYTRRIFSRLGVITGEESYEELRTVFESGLKSDAMLYNEYHALIVKHGKEVCRSRPDCDQCCLTAMCQEYSGI